MPEYALIDPDGSTILKTHVLLDDAPTPRADLHPDKPFYLPVVEVQPTYDPTWQALGEMSETVEAEQVTRTWTVVEQDVAVLRAAKMAEIDAQFAQRTYAPVTYGANDFETDDTARKRINNAIMLMQAGKLPSPIAWATYQTVAMVDLTTDDLLNIAALVAVREQTLFGKYASIVSSLPATAEALAGFDTSVGWD